MSGGEYRVSAASVVLHGIRTGSLLSAQAAQFLVTAEEYELLRVVSTQNVGILNVDVQDDPGN